MSTLSKNQLFDNKYTILFFVKKGKSTETYRVKSAEGKLCFLKLFYPAALHHTSFDTNGNLLEIEFLRRFKHPNIVSYEDRGEVIVGNKKFLYLVEHYIAGETLAERMLREPISTLYDIRQVLSG
ncbi:MAG: hypothetical protein LBH82_02980, partial [Bacteroidales bacterium]|nr:hypothetical protein [Bacteroidales bacterium]